MRRIWIYFLFLSWASPAFSQTRIMLIGNSITDGMGSSNGLGFRDDLYDHLTVLSFPFSFVGSARYSPYQGHFWPGVRIDDLYFGPGGNGSYDVGPDMTAFEPHVVLIHIGTNDIDPPDPIGPYTEDDGNTFTVSTVSGRLAYFLSCLLDWQTGERGSTLKKVYISQIIQKVGQENRIMEFNTAIARIVQDSEEGRIAAIPRGSLRMVDQYSSFYPESMLSDDGVHPNEYGYSHMGEIYFQSLRYLPMHLVRVSEEEQTGPVGGMLLEALRVKVTDDYGNGTGGTKVFYKVTEGDAVVLNVEPVTTDSLGFAGASVLLGGTESSTVVAYSHGLIDSLVAFTVHAIGFVQIGGSVSYYSHYQPVPGVLIDWVERGTVIDTTEESGVYSFDRFPFGETVTLHPHKDRWKDMSLSTVLSYDAALIARNAVGLETLPYYESLAADVDGDGQISMIDASQIARYVVGFELPAEVSIGEWRFLPDVLTLDPLSSTVENIDFTGFVMGDVHGGWHAVTAGDVSMPVPYRTLPSYSAEDSVITVDFVLDEDRILACDLVCEYDADIIEFLTMEKSDWLSPFQTNHLESEKGSVKIGMYGIHPVQNKDGVLHLKFLQKKEDASTTVLLHDIFLNDIQKENMWFDIRTGKGNPLPQKMTLMQNFPNPFNGRTHIQFTIPVAAHVRVAVFNSLGQEVTVLLDEDREKGMHEILWRSTDAHGIPLSSGCYFYVLSSGGTRLIKKMEYIQ